MPNAGIIVQMNVTTGEFATTMIWSASCIVSEENIVSYTMMPDIAYARTCFDPYGLDMLAKGTY